MISIIEQNDRYDLRVDNQSFSNMYLEEKTKQSFKREDETAPAQGSEMPAKASTDEKSSSFDFAKDSGFSFQKQKQEQQQEPAEFSWTSAPTFSFSSSKTKSPSESEERKEKPGIFAGQKQRLGAPGSSGKKEVKKSLPTTEQLLPMGDILSQAPAAALPNDLVLGGEAKPQEKSNGLDILAGFSTESMQSKPKQATEQKQPPTKEQGKKSILDDDIDALADILGGNRQ